MDALTDEELTALVGSVAAIEFRNAREWHREEMTEYARTLPNLTVRDLFDASRSAIHGSALALSLKGNWEHVHFRASACFYESERRNKLSGHRPYCTATIYARAHDAVMVSNGHAPSSFSPCTCFDVGD